MGRILTCVRLLDNRSGGITCETNQQSFGPVSYSLPCVTLGLACVIIW